MQGCNYVAKFHSYQRRRVLTLQGEVVVTRAYYYCRRCHRSYCPYDEALGLRDGVSPGLRPLVSLAGTLVPFADAADDVLRRLGVLDVVGVGQPPLPMRPMTCSGVLPACGRVP